MSETTFLELVEGVGVETDFVVDQKSGLEIPNPKAGEPAPLTHQGINIPVPVAVGDDVVTTTRMAAIEPRPSIGENWYDNPVDAESGTLACARIIPGTRIIETNAPPVVSVLLESGHYAICDPPKSGAGKEPTKAQLEAQAKEAGVDVGGLNKQQIADAIVAGKAAGQPASSVGEAGAEAAAPASAGQEG